MALLLSKAYVDASQPGHEWLLSSGHHIRKLVEAVLRDMKKY
jgi:hypothetical protein